MSPRRASAHPGQAGFALLNALAILAVIAALGAVMTRDAVQSRHVAAMMIRADQSRHYALAAEALVVQALAADFDSGPIDHLGEAWAQGERRFAVEEGTITGTLRDLQSTVDLNMVVAAPDPQRDLPARVDPDGYRVVAALLEKAGAPARSIDRLAEWILLSAPELRGLAGDAPYLAQDPPYRRAGLRLHGLSEARLIDGIDAAVMARLRPLATALPEPAPVNVNTAPRAVLAALYPDAGRAALDAILAARAEAPFASVAAFLEEAGRRIAPAGIAAVPAGRLSVQSAWFELTLKSSLEGVTLTHVSIIHRDPDTGAVSVRSRSRAPL